MILPQFAHDHHLGLEFWVNTCGNERSPVSVAVGQHGGMTSSWERRRIRGLSLFAS